MFLKGNDGSEFSRIVLHGDERKIRKIVARLEIPKRVNLRGIRNDTYADDYFEFPDKEFRDEGSGRLIALPGRVDRTGLRLFGLQWELRTFIWCGMVDKGDWTGKWQDHPHDEVRAQIGQYDAIGRAIQRQIDLGVLTVNEGGFGFRHFEHEGLQYFLPISEYL